MLIAKIYYCSRGYRAVIFLPTAFIFNLFFFFKNVSVKFLFTLSPSYFKKDTISAQGDRLIDTLAEEA